MEVVSENKMIKQYAQIDMRAINIWVEEQRSQKMRLFDGVGRNEGEWGIENYGRIQIMIGFEEDEQLLLRIFKLLRIKKQQCKRQ